MIGTAGNTIAAHIANDGETYGHHHRFGEMALAAACARLQASRAATLTNHAAFLAAHPPTMEARVVDGSSWSCAHGVDRWRANCGCRAARTLPATTLTGHGEQAAEPVAPVHPVLGTSEGRYKKRNTV